MEILMQAPVTAAIIAVNLAASLYAFSNEAFMKDNMFFVGPIRAGQLHRMVSSGFIHVNVLHLIINMYVLFQFGPVLELAELGARDFAIVYFASLLGGSLWALLDNWRKPFYQAVGASGAISGIIASYCLFFPVSTLLLFGIIPIPALLVLILLLVGSAYFSTRPNTIIGHEAHFGGALTGAAVTIALRPEAWSTFTSALAGYLS